VGVGQVIKGWDVGLVNLCKGVKVRAITSIFTYR
ncbi:MAG: FKBP-type peptidyl-prolyl cis-trans isomerase, partial [Bacillariaceae sp.]